MQDLLTSMHQSLRAANTTEEALDAKTLENHTAQFGNFLYEILGNVHKSQEVRSTVHRTPEAIKVLLNAKKDHCWHRKQPSHLNEILLESPRLSS